MARWHPPNPIDYLHDTHGEAVEKLDKQLDDILTHLEEIRKRAFQGSSEWQVFAEENTVRIEAGRYVQSAVGIIPIEQAQKEKLAKGVLAYGPGGQAFWWDGSAFQPLSYLAQVPDKNMAHAERLSPLSGPDGRASAQWVLQPETATGALSDTHRTRIYRGQDVGSLNLEITQPNATNFCQYEIFMFFEGDGEATYAQLRIYNRAGDAALSLNTETYYLWPSTQAVAEASSTSNIWFPLSSGGGGHIVRMMMTHKDSYGCSLAIRYDAPHTMRTIAGFRGPTTDGFMLKDLIAYDGKTFKNVMVAVRRVR